MSSILKYFLLTIAFIVPLQADMLQDNFNAGNQLYQQGQYEQSVEKYQLVLQAGFESGELYFNLGNVYYKLNQLGLARLYYERAAILLKNDEALTDNLALLNQRLIDKIPVPPQFFLFNWWDALLGIFNIHLLTWLTAGFFIIFLSFAALRRHALKRGRSRQFRSIYITSLIVLVFIVLIYGQKIYRLETEKFGIILQPSVTSYAEPSISGTEVFVLHEGTKVRIERSNSGWYEIKLADGKTGWLNDKNLEII